MEMALHILWSGPYPCGGTVVGSVMMNARLAIDNVFASKRMDMDEFLFTWKDQ